MNKLKYILLFAFTSTIMLASMPNKVSDYFYNNDFEKIIRYDMLHFKDNELDENSNIVLQKALKKIKEYKKSSTKIKITLVGHLYKPEDYYKEKIDNNLSFMVKSENTKSNGSEYVLNIENRLIQEGVAKDILYPSVDAGRDLAYADAQEEGASLSNRVMLTIYVLKPEDIDSDKDGVFDMFDRCVGTPRGSKVDINGCPIDSDHDGVLDYKDKCPETPPKGVIVDAHGCPLDSDNDGIVDYKDRCENTPININVDPNGCPVKQTLKLYFKSASDKILKNSYAEVKRFAEFMQKNPGYKVKIIGHTDSIGKAVVNMALSIKRAKAVKESLILEGVNASRIVATGRGELEPIKSNRTKEGRKVNRRIEIELFH